MEESVFLVVEEDAADVQVGIEAGDVKTNIAKLNT